MTTTEPMGPDGELDEPKIERLTGYYVYRCLKCQKRWSSRGDRDPYQEQELRKHWVECWGMSPAEANR